MRVPHALRRVGWGFADQALSSVTNFALTVAVASVSAPREFGLYATLAMALQVVMVMSRGVTSDPLLAAGGRDPGEARSDSLSALALALVLGVAGGLVVAAGSLLAGGDARKLVLAFAVTLPLVLVQDCARFVAAAQRRPVLAFVSDAVWTVVLVAAYVGVRLDLWSSGSAPVMVLAWGAGAGAGGLVALALGRWPLRPRGIRSWLASSWSVSRFYVLENALLNGLNLLVIALVGLLAGLEASGAIRAAVALFGPLQVITLGARGFLIPEISRLAQRDLERARRTSFRIGAALAAVGFAWMGVLMVLPDRVGRSLLGQTWALARPVLPLVSLDSVAVLFITGMFIGIRAVDRRGTGFRTRMALAGPRLVLAPLGAVAAGAMGVAWVFACLAPVQAYVWGRQNNRAFERVAAHRAGAGPEAGVA